ncbi:FRM4A-like protein [Mya arenaria]|uniref:FRM4A-like protein n=1 Tax=Mya arenaria TaxID=6604 RepID=A0ABY7FWG4_MYAAR|nr:FRM4A-like protein [Mya arenaria]
MPSTMVHAASVRLKDCSLNDTLQSMDASMDEENNNVKMALKSPSKTVNFDPAETSKVQREMYTAMKARREALEEILKKRTEDLKLLCIKEGELTGVLPPETPLAPGEEPPQIRRRVGTAFSLHSNIMGNKDESEDMSQTLELELELQKQITSAAHKLASDKSVSRFVRKQRRHSFIKAQNKLKEMEKKLSEYRKGSVPSSPATSGKFDGTYCVTDTEVIHRPAKSRHSSSVAHRLSRSFREKNLLKYHRFIDSGKSPVKGGIIDMKNLSVIIDSSMDDSRDLTVESRLEESRLADTSMDTLATSSSEESYKISNDSLYPSSFKNSQTKEDDSPLDLSFLTPPPAHKQREVACMSPNTRRSKRASWHHTMFPKYSPLTPRSNKETAV